MNENRDRQFDVLGLRMEAVRRILAKKLNPWASLYWSEVFIQLERRWLHNTTAPADSEFYETTFQYHQDKHTSRLSKGQNYEQLYF